MERELTLRLSDEVYEALLRVAQMADLAPEQWARRYLVDEIRSIDEDSLLKLAGCVQTDLTDLGERHDAYLQDRLLEELRSGPGA